MFFSVVTKDHLGTTQFGLRIYMKFKTIGCNQFNVKKFGVVVFFYHRLGVVSMKRNDCATAQCSVHPDVASAIRKQTSLFNV